MCGIALTAAKIQGAIVRILSDFCKLNLAQSSRTFAAVRLLPPFWKMGCRDRSEDASSNRIARTDRDRVARLQPSLALVSIDCSKLRQFTPEIISSNSISEWNPSARRAKHRHAEKFSGCEKNPSAPDK
jgi:hypothetical protein